MKTTQLRAFDAVARLGSFTKAAERLRLTQPAVTIQVRALEDAYGIKLFERREGRIALTLAGQGLMLRTQDLFAAEDQVRSYLEQSEQLEIGDIRISADSPHFAMGLIGWFQGRYPGVRVSVDLGNTPTVWRHLLDGRADVAVVSNPPKDPRVEARTLGVRGLCALVPAGHVLASQVSVSLKKLEEFSCIFREAPSNTQKTLARALKKNQMKLLAALELNSREAVVEAVSAGLGIGFIFAGEDVGDARVAAIPIHGLEQENRDTIACLNSQKNRNSIKAFLKEAMAWRESNGLD